MPVVFYILGIAFALVCANFAYGAVVGPTNFAALSIALGGGIISAIFFSTGAIIETMRRDPE
jgi:hypothetical protein